MAPDPAVVVAGRAPVGNFGDLVEALGGLDSFGFERQRFSEAQMKDREFAPIVVGLRARENRGELSSGDSAAGTAHRVVREFGDYELREGLLLRRVWDDALKVHVLRGVSRRAQLAATSTMAGSHVVGTGKHLVVLPRVGSARTHLRAAIEPTVPGGLHPIHPSDEGNAYILHAQDAFTGLPWLKAVPREDAATIAMFLAEDVFLDIAGFPAVLRSDHRSSHVNKVVAVLNASFVVGQAFGSSYRLQSQGYIE